MTQSQYDVLCKVIQNGAPALANELIGAVNELINQLGEAVKAKEEESKEVK